MRIFTILQRINKKQFYKLSIILIFWIGIWQLGAMLIHNSILLASPLEVILELIRLIQTIDFYQSIFQSLLRILTGFFLGLSIGIFLGVLAYFRTIIREILAPMIALLKSIPIASFVVLILIWVGSKYLSIWVSFLVVFPNVYLHTIAGLDSTDKKLLEMAKVFHLSFKKKIIYLYLPAMIPYLISCIEVTIGLSFKSGVAAEVIATPQFSFGEKLYMAKIHLNTAGVFAWTIVIICVSFCVEKVILLFLKQYQGKTFKRAFSKSEAKHTNKAWDDYGECQYIQIKNLSKFYNQKEVLKHVNLKLKKGGIYYLMGPSGCGKTTFFHILLGIIKADAGQIRGITKEGVSVMFQEPRLLEDYSAIENAFLFCTLAEGREWEELEYMKLLPRDSMYKPVRELSVGMQRRVAILRAMNYHVPIVILDEPFAGLDEKTKKITASYILEKKGDKTLLISTHNKEDLLLLEGKVIDGDESCFNWNNG